MALQQTSRFLKKNKVRAIIECKGGAIGVSEYVRGIGQIFQYEYFFENHLSLKNYEFCQNFNSVLVFPESVLISGIIIFAKSHWYFSLLKYLRVCGVLL
ncbi:hypothetical protein JP0020_04830 [Helicobacter pylori]